MGLLSGLFGGDDKEVNVKYGAPPVNSFVAGQYLDRLGYSPAATQQATWSPWGGSPWRFPVGGTEPSREPGYEYAQFGGKWYQRPEGTTGGFSPAVRDQMIRQQSTARNRYGAQMSRQAGGMNPAIQRRLAELEQGQLLERAQAEQSYQDQALAALRGMSAPVQAGQTQVGQGPLPGIGQVTGNVLNYLTLSKLFGGK